MGGAAGGSAAPVAERTTVPTAALPMARAGGDGVGHRILNSKGMDTAAGRSRALGPHLGEMKAPQRSLALQAGVPGGSGDGGPGNEQLMVRQVADHEQLLVRQVADQVRDENDAAEMQGGDEEAEPDDSQLCDGLDGDAADGAAVAQAGPAAAAAVEQERLIQQLVQEESDAEEETDSPAGSARGGDEAGEEEAAGGEEEEADEPVFAVSQQSSCLPAGVSYGYVQVAAGEDPDRLQACVRRPLPDYWPDPRADSYQAFFRAFFTGQGRGAEAHDWGAEIRGMKEARDGGEEAPVLSVWQAAGYLHAQRVIEGQGLPGCLFWWTPGSGKSVMVALLLELLYYTDLDVYVVSTPQNTRNNGLDECARSLLRFSPVFNLGGREPTRADVTGMVRAFRSRPNGRPIYKKNFMSFRQFGRFCRQADALSKVAVIFDESHELFNDKMCDRAGMWGDALERLSRGRGNKVFALSGTPGRNPAEMLLQVELVRRARGREDHAGLLGGDGWERRLARYCAGLVSYVDGSKDLSRFPADAGVAKVECEMTEEQLFNFSTRSGGHLRCLGFRDFAHAAEGLASGGAARKIAVLSARLAQSAAGVFFGGPRGGLQRALETEPSLESVGRFAPKLRRVAEAILRPDGTPPLETKHFVYTDSGRTLRPLIQALRQVTVDGTRAGRQLFKQLLASDFEWGRDGRLCLARPHQRLLDHPEQLAFAVLVGGAGDRRKLLAAFGRISADGVRQEGLARPGGAPLVQALLGTQDSNQGLTLLRVQRVHLLEPPPKGWPEVLKN